MQVDVIPINEFDERIDGLLKVDLDNLPFPSDFINQYQILIYIPPMRFGGNHKHPRREIFFSLNDNIELHWIDKNGITHVNKMRKENQIYIFDVHPFVPHAIVNLSQKSAAVLLEFTNDRQHNIEPYTVFRETPEILSLER